MKVKLGILSERTAEVKNLKKGFDHDGFDMWACSLHIDGKKVADFIPNGWGGSDTLNPVNKTDDTKAALEWFVQRANRIMGDEYHENDSLLINELITLTLIHRQVKRDMKKSIVFVKPDTEIGNYSFIKGGELESVRRTFPDAMFADDDVEAFVRHACRDMNLFNYMKREPKED